MLLFKTIILGLALHALNLAQRVISLVVLWFSHKTVFMYITKAYQAFFIYRYNYEDYIHQA